MRLALLVNPASGSAGDADALAARLGGDVDVHDVREAAPHGRLPQDLEPVPDRVVVAGGDGSLGPAAMLAQRLGVPLAVVPAGTANDFARALGLPLDPDEAAALAGDPQAQTREMEVGSAGGRPFVNAASAGLSVAAAEAAHPFKGRLGPLAYPLGALRAALGEQPLRLVVRVDGEERFAGDAWQVVVAATGHFGGGSAIGGTSSGDGRLDVAIVPGGSRLGLARRALGMVRGKLVEQGDVLHLRGDAIEVDGVGAFNVDGERCGVEPSRFATAGRVDVVVP